MKVEQNNRNKHVKYDDYKAHQSIVSELVKDDVVVLTVNGVETFRCNVLYGNNAHVNITLLDKGSISIEMTDEQIEDAIALWRASQP